MSALLYAGLAYKALTRPCRGLLTVRPASQGLANAVTAWAKALAVVTNVVLLGYRDNQVYVEVQGRIPDGPRVLVKDELINVHLVPVLALYSERLVSVDALAELAATGRLVVSS